MIFSLGWSRVLPLALQYASAMPATISLRSINDFFYFCGLGQKQKAKNVKLFDRSTQTPRTRFSNLDEHASIQGGQGK
jgi:hypothetical protein